MKTFSVKELANLSGVSRRTLQYYDNEGILTADKNAKGHRTYNENHLRQLMQINFYKSVGFSLEVIRNKLRQVSSDIGELLNTQSIHLQRQLEGIKAKIHGIQVSKTLHSEGFEIPWELLANLMNTLDAFLRVDNNRNQWNQGERNLINEGEPYLAKLIEMYSLPDEAAQNLFGLLHRSHKQNGVG